MTRTLRRGTVVAMLAGALAGSVLLAVPGAAEEGRHAKTFATAQKLLEAQLSARVAQLDRLSADVSGATTLTAAHSATLDTSIAAAQSSIDALAAKVPTDTTKAELRTDRRTMIRENRVFAVLTPQVFETIGADAVAAQVTALRNEEPGLLAAVNALVGEHGYANALRHYTQFVTLVNRASLKSTNIANRVLAQSPANYPHDVHAFVGANHGLLAANIAIAHADYDATVVGLASGGYTGS